MSEPVPSCAMCGKPVEGLTEINGKRYCHGRQLPSCYEKAQWEFRGGWSL